jgi:hypothetical protein
MFKRLKAHRAATIIFALVLACFVFSELVGAGSNRVIAAFGLAIIYSGMLSPYFICEDGASGVLLAVVDAPVVFVTALVGTIEGIVRDNLRQARKPSSSPKFSMPHDDRGAA